MSSIVKKCDRNGSLTDTYFFFALLQQIKYLVEWQWATVSSASVSHTLMHTRICAHTHLRAETYHEDYHIRWIVSCQLRFLLLQDFLFQIKNKGFCLTIRQGKYLALVYLLLSEYIGSLYW